jgi:uncharacterized repeat protein (TIGR03803 family)
MMVSAVINEGARFAMFASRLCSIVLLALMIGGTGAKASHLTTVYNFCTATQGLRCLDGKTPDSRLVDLNGELYGTASAGGLKLLGTLYRVSTSGSFKTLYTFCLTTNCPDGARPGSYLTHGPLGIYGVATAGGVADGGLIFKFSDGGGYSVVYKFCSEAKCADGAQPVSVLFDSKGNLIGTAAAGGSQRGGTAFMIDSGGKFHLLHNFCAEAGCTDGASPGGLVRGRDGNYYGTTLAGGKNHAGTVFRMTPAGAVTVLYAFCGAAKCADGEQPTPMLVQGRNGNFYGTTVQRGANATGTIFEVSPAGVFHTIYSFCAKADCSDGATPTDGLVLSKDGSFYGTASAGGRFYNGAIYHLTAAGNYSLVYNFCALHGCFDGTNPGISPTVGSDGFLYGTTAAGGDRDNVGTVYRLEP